MSVISVEFQDKFPKLHYTLIGYDKLRYENDWQSIEHAHPFCEILIVTNGKGSFINSARAIPIKRGNIIVTNPNILHTEQSATSEEVALEYVAISVSGVLFSDKPAEGFQQSIIFNLEKDWSTVTTILDYIDREIRDKNVYWESSVHNLIEELIILLSRNAQLESLHSERSSSRGRGTQFVPLLQQYLEHYYANNITLDDLAQKFFVNKFYLVKCFRKITGMTPILYLESVRIKKAQSLLTTTNFSVTEISQQVGFASSAYFSKKFKDLTGQSPTQYAKANTRKKPSK